MGIDRLELRREIGAAVARLNSSEQHAREANAKARDLAHKRWRDLVAQADEARREYERLSKVRGDAAALDTIRRACVAHPELQVYEHDEYAPVCCEATGLAVFKGDKTYGEPGYGCILVDAVTLNVDPVV